MKNSIIKTYCLLATTFLIFFLSSCKKSDDPSPDTPTETKGEKRPAGIPQGTPVTKIIGPQGGTISLPDGSIKITVPQDALTTPTDITIQPLSNTNRAGIGNAFRLTPHGSVFRKAVSITVSYTLVADSVNAPGTLGLSFQDSSSVWQYTAGNEVDTVNKTVTFRSIHFSDWSLMSWLTLNPVQASLSEGEEITLKALRYVPIPACGCLDDLLVPTPAVVTYPVGEPQALETKFIGQWNLAGPGTLIPTTANQAVYKAPASVITNYTAAVSLKLKSAHTLLLVSNIQLKSDNFFEMRIDGGAWKAHNSAGIFSTAPGKAGLAFIEDNEKLSMFFPARTGSFQWDGNAGNSSCGMNYWPSGNAAAYQAMYYQNNATWNSGGNMTITEYGNVGQYISGSFQIAPAGYFSSSDGHQIRTSTIEGRFRLKRFQ